MGKLVAFISFKTLIAASALAAIFSATSSFAQSDGKLNKRDKPTQLQLSSEQITDQGIAPKDTLTVKQKRLRDNMRGYVLTHEHPMVAMSFGGNYAFTGAENNYRHGIMVDGYTAQCSGCLPGRTDCDHGEFHGTLFEVLGQVAPDIQGHFPHYGPNQRSFSHVKYSTEWVREAFNPTTPQHQDARMRIMVAYAVENEVMCDLLYEANLGNGGTGGDGWECQRGDSFQSLERQVNAIKAWAAENSSWMEIAYSASEARHIVQRGKLAIIIGIEADYAFGAENQTFPPVRRLNEYHDMGVRTFYISHKLNSRLSGADIYRSPEESSGQLLRMNQAMAGCFYLDDNVTAFPLIKNPNNSSSHNYCDNDSVCGPNHFRGSGLNNGCNAKANDFSNATIINLSKKRNKLNGFAVYPKPDGFSGSGGTHFDGGIEYNNLGLSNAGQNVVRAAMKKGMIITIDHISKVARMQVRDISLERDKYPLNGFHNNPNEMLIGGTRVRAQGANLKKTQFPNEYDFDKEDLEAIKDTNGILGVRLGPLDAKDNIVPNNILTNSGAAMEDCPGSITENAKILAYLMNKGINVGYSLDFSTVTQGTYSATKARCNTIPENDGFHKYQGHVTEGLSHIGMAKKIHNELERVDFNSEYLDRLKNDGVEEFLTMWDLSEAKSDLFRSNPQNAVTLRKPNSNLSKNKLRP